MVQLNRKKLFLMCILMKSREEIKLIQHIKSKLSMSFISHVHAIGSHIVAVQDDYPGRQELKYLSEIGSKKFSHIGTPSLFTSSAQVACGIIAGLP